MKWWRRSYSSAALDFLNRLEILRRYLPTTSPVALGAMAHARRTRAASSIEFLDARARALLWPELDEEQRKRPPMGSPKPRTDC